MSPQEFCYWLQGYFEIVGTNAPTKSLNPEQVQVIKDYLILVFTKVTPSININPFPPLPNTFPNTTPLIAPNNPPCITCNQVISK